MRVRTTWASPARSPNLDAWWRCRASFERAEPRSSWAVPTRAFRLRWCGRGRVQTSRGCRFECEFCDVIQYAGRKQRHKAPSQVLAELDGLYERGYRQVFLADDNFTVYRSRAKELLLALAHWNSRRAAGKVTFLTQVSIDCTRDDELLCMCAQAGLTTVFIG